MNPNLWPYIILALNVVLTACAPLLTAFLNNRHQEKLSKMELFEKRRLDAFEEYLNHAGAELGRSSGGASVHFRQAHANAYMYADAETRKLMDQFYESSRHSGVYSAPDLLDRISAKFSFLIENPKKS